jgi:hypothetical protein
MARPTDFTPKIAETICDLIASGLSLREICRKDEFPDFSTVKRWLRKNEEFRAQYAHAREEQADYLVDEIMEIADDGTNDWMKRQGDDGQEIEVANYDHIARSRLRVDARKWAASKLAPKKYGDKISQEISGSLALTSKEQRDAAVSAAIRADS